MKATQTEIKEILKILSETPKRFAVASKHRAKAQHQNQPDQSGWSVNEILWHLRSCVDVWGKDIDEMLIQDTPKLRYLSPRTWMRKTNYAELAFGDSLSIFVEQREAFLKQLKALEFDDWSRGAVIKDRIHTVFTHTRRMALHEQGHWDQIEELINKS